MDSSTLQRIKLRYGIVGNCEALDRALDIALKIAPVDLSVLVTGENGVGKEVFPRIIHDHSLRKNKKYFAVNCGAIPEGTIDSELFGHEKGAFTGAVERREGYFAVANGGTLFLDEVGELPAPTQARLLRVLETGEYIPVGASEVRRTDVRIVAATNVNMEQAINEGKFREDLYYRLNSVSIAVPPLRERGDDAVLLFRKFALEMSEKYNMPPIRLDDEASRILAAYSWPGNVRQLKNVAENMSVTSEKRIITPDILHRYLPEAKRHDQLVAVEQKSSQHSFENEREILYQILFDLRRDVTIGQYAIDAESMMYEMPYGCFYIGKFRPNWKSTIGSGTAARDVNFPMMRYAHILLMYAEAANEYNGAPTPEAIDALRQVRLRAFGGDESKIGEIPADHDGFLEALIEENKLEFAGESWRRTELCRWGILYETLTENKAELLKLAAREGRYENVDRYRIFVPQQAQFQDPENNIPYEALTPADLTDGLNLTTAEIEAYEAEGKVVVDMQDSVSPCSHADNNEIMAYGVYTVDPDGRRVYGGSDGYATDNVRYVNLFSGLQKNHSEILPLAQTVMDVNLGLEGQQVPGY